MSRRILSAPRAPAYHRSRTGLQILRPAERNLIIMPKGFRIRCPDIRLYYAVQCRSRCKYVPSLLCARRLHGFFFYRTIHPLDMAAVIPAGIGCGTTHIVFAPGKYRGKPGMSLFRGNGDGRRIAACVCSFHRMLLPVAGYRIFAPGRRQCRFIIRHRYQGKIRRRKLHCAAVFRPVRYTGQLRRRPVNQDAVCRSIGEIPRPILRFHIN